MKLTIQLSISCSTTFLWSPTKNLLWTIWTICWWAPRRPFCRRCYWKEALVPPSMVDWAMSYCEPLSRLDSRVSILKMFSKWNSWFLRLWKWDRRWIHWQCHCLVDEYDWIFGTYLIYFASTLLAYPFSNNRMFSRQMREFSTGSFPCLLSFMVGSMSKWIYD